MTSTPSSTSTCAMASPKLGMRPRPRPPGNRAGADDDRRCGCRVRGRTCESRNIFLHGGARELKNPMLEAPCAATAFCSPSAAAVNATSQSTGCSTPPTRTIGWVARSGEYMPSNPKRSAVGDPGLVDLLVLARHHPHHPAAQHVAIEVGAEGIVRRHQRTLRHLPGARAIAKRLVVERATGTDR